MGDGTPRQQSQSDKAMSTDHEQNIRPWQRDIHAAFKASNICHVSYVPDGGHRGLIELCQRDPDIGLTALTTAAMVWLGLALAQPDRPVIVFTGDGEMLKGLGAFATIVQHNRANLTIVVLDNEQYAESGMQKTATGFGTDLAAVAKACGIPQTATLVEQSEIGVLRDRLRSRNGTQVVVLKIKPGDQPRTVPEREGTLIASRFMRGVQATA